MGLLAKLLEAAKSIQQIEKTGYNAFHDYRYATEEDIVKPIRQALYSRNVMFTSEVTNCEFKDDIAIVSMRFTFYDVETGEQLSFNWVGSGQDKGDKGVYKAQTGALKYFLLKTFLLPSATDPENAKLEDHSARVEELATDNQKNLIRRLVSEYATANSKPVQEVERAFGIDYDKLTKSKASELIDKLKRK